MIALILVYILTYFWTKNKMVKMILPEAVITLTYFNLWHILGTHKQIRDWSEFRDCGSRMSSYGHCVNKLESCIFLISTSGALTTSLKMLMVQMQRFKLLAFYKCIKKVQFIYMFPPTIKKVSTNEHISAHCFPPPSVLSCSWYMQITCWNVVKMKWHHEGTMSRKTRVSHT